MNKTNKEPETNGTANGKEVSSSDLLALSKQGCYSNKEQVLFRVIDQDNDMHEYIIYTNGRIKGFPGRPLVFNYFRRICKLGHEFLKESSKIASPEQNGNPSKFGGLQELPEND